MNKHEKRLKRLAEENVLCGKELTAAEYKELKESKYADLISKPKSGFDKLFEQVVAGKPPEAKLTKNSLYSHVNKSSVRDLVDDIEDTFDLGIQGQFGKYSKVDLEDLKSFILDYVEENMFNRETATFVNTTVAESETVQQLLYKLYLCC